MITQILSFPLQPHPPPYPDKPPGCPTPESLISVHFGSVWLCLAPFRVCFGSFSGPLKFRGVGWGRGGVRERGFRKGKEYSWERRLLKKSKDFLAAHKQGHAQCKEREDQGRARDSKNQVIGWQSILAAIPNCYASAHHSSCHVQSRLSFPATGPLDPATDFFSSCVLGFFARGFSRKCLH